MTAPPTVTSTCAICRPPRPCSLPVPMEPRGRPRKRDRRVPRASTTTFSADGRYVAFELDLHEPGSGRPGRGSQTCSCGTCSPTRRSSRAGRPEQSGSEQQSRGFHSPRSPCDGHYVTFMTGSTNLSSEDPRHQGRHLRPRPADEFPVALESRSPPRATRARRARVRSGPRSWSRSSSAARPTGRTAPRSHSRPAIRRRWLPTI